jgi:hypothetical protein
VKLDIKRIVQRGLYYVQLGSSLGGLPLALLSFVTIIYYNLIINVPYLHVIFAQFYIFTIVAAIVVTVLFAALGYVYKMKSKFFIAQVEVDIDSNPYQKNKVTPNAVPFWESQVELMEMHGIDCSKIKEILTRSGSTKYLQREDALR